MDYRQKRDMERLAHMLETDVDVPEHWNFSLVSNAEMSHGGQRSCGSEGCAMGWMPVLFEELELSSRGALRLRDSGKTDTDAVTEFFGITLPQADEVFVHGFLVSDKTSPKYVQPADVARRIRELIRVYFPPKITEIATVDSHVMELFRGRNILTPSVRGYYQLASYRYAELSQGLGMSNQPIYGVTVRPDPDGKLSKLCVSQQEALEHIRSLS